MLRSCDSGFSTMGLEADTNWVKQTDFTFAACVAYLKSRVDLQDDPSTLFLQYRLFNELGDNNVLAKVRYKIEDYVDNLVDLQESGFQMRDCLVVTAYANLNNWYANSPNKFEEVVIPRLRIAASSNWFDEPELAASALSIQDHEGIMQLRARNYFTKNINAWLKRGFLNGILHYALYFGEDEEVSGYLRQIDWSGHDFGVQSLALRYFSNLPQRDYLIQRILSKSIFSQLEHSNTIAAFANTIHNSDTKRQSSQRFLPLTDYEITLALLSIKEAEHHEIVGFRSHQISYLETLQRMQKIAEDGGTYTSRFQIVVYELAILVSVTLIIHWLLNLQYIQDWVSPIVEMLVQFAPLVLLIYLRRKRLAPLIENWIKSPKDT